MSRLALHGRPWVVFDPANKDHRRWFANFNTTGAWGYCPVRFVVNDDHGDLITQIQRELIQFYVNKEFGTSDNPRTRPKPFVAKTPQKSKLRKVVDKLAKK
jgi:hypothetical protein